MKKTFSNDKRKPRKCADCGKLNELKWTGDLPTPGGFIELGYNVCTCGNMVGAIEAHPANQPEGFLKFTLAVFMFGAVAQYNAKGGVK